MKDRENVNIHLGAELRRWLDAEARSQDRPMSRIIRQALELYRRIQTPQVLEGIEQASEERLGVIR